MPNRTLSDPKGVDRVNPPHFYPIKPFKLIDPQRVDFDNGATAFYFHAGEQDLVRIEWNFQNDYQSEDDALIPSCIPAMLMEGTRNRSNAEIADLVDFHGAYLVPAFNSDFTTLTLFTLNKHLPVLLPVVRDVLTNAIFPEKELNTYLRNRKQRLEVSLRKNDFTARRIFNSVLFGETRYGKAPDLDSFDAVRREHLQTYYAKHYRPANCTMTIAGKITTETRRSIEEVFGEKWNATIAEETQSRDSLGNVVSPAFPPPTGQLHLETRPDALQSAIRLGFRTIQRKHPDFPGLQFVNTALGGYFGSRLMANIREDKGYTYGIGSGIVSLKHGGYLTIATEVGVDVTQATLTEIEHEIRTIKDHLLPPEELELVRNYLMGNLLGSLENVFSHADHFKQVYFSGLRLDYYDYYQKTILEISAEEVQQLANKYLDFDKMEKVIVGKM